MIIIEKNTEKILETQPYEMFLRKFEALQIGTSSSLHIQIEPTNKECLEEFKCGFTIDPCYAKRYMLDFSTTASLRKMTDIVWYTVWHLNLRLSSEI